MFEAIGNIELKSIGLSSDAAANAQNLIKRADSGEFKGEKGDKGDKGNTGAKGDKGEKGDKSYLHVAYADSSDGATGFSLVDSINKLYIGQYADYISTPSENPMMYHWTLIKGDKGNTGAKGDTGISVTEMVDEWYLSSSSSDKKDGSWSTVRVEWQSGLYFWRRIRTSYSDGSTSYSPSEDGYFDSVITNSASDSSQAKATANSAKATASDANNTANEANATASDAKKTANEAKNTANTANDTANTAKDTADAAASTASGAADTANAAKSTADSASTIAGQAKSTAETAKTTANAAKSTADTAKSTADTAKSTAETNATDLTNYITSNNSTLEVMQSLIDGSIMTWFFPRPPADANEPTSKWTTTDLKNQHLGDLYYDTDTGYCYRYQVEHQVYSWQRITDVDVTKALADAKNAQDTADGKRRVFTVQPTPPYDVGDLWAAGANGDIKRCRIAKTSEQSYAASDWELASKYTDDTTANAAKSTADNANSKIDNMQIGGRNLYLGTKAFSGEAWHFSKEQNLTDETYNGFRVVKDTGRWNGVRQYVHVNRGDILTFSYWARSDSETDWNAGFVGFNYSISDQRERDGYKVLRNCAVLSGSQYPKITNVWKRYSLTCQCLDDDCYALPRIEVGSANIPIYLCGFKVELGNKATDWTPAPEDVEATTDQLRDDLNSTESQLNNQITEVSKKTDSTNSALNEARDELSKRIADTMAQAQMAAAAAKVAQTDLNNYMNYKVDPQLKTMSDFMAAYNLSFHQDSSGLYITNQNSDGTPADISLRLGNDRISFIQGQGDDAFEVAFISDKQLYITSGEFLNGLRMGNYAFIPGAAGDLSIKKVK